MVPEVLIKIIIHNEDVMYYCSLYVPTHDNVQEWEGHKYDRNVSTSKKKTETTLVLFWKTTK